MNHPLVVELARKYNKTPAQVLLRHLVHLRIGVIPKSLTPERVRENFDIFNFKLTGFKKFLMFLFDCFRW